MERIFQSRFLQFRVIFLSRVNLLVELFFGAEIISVQIFLGLSLFFLSIKFWAQCLIFQSRDNILVQLIFLVEN